MRFKITHQNLQYISNKITQLEINIHKGRKSIHYNFYGTSFKGK